MKKDIEAAYNAEIQYYKDKEEQHSNVLDILDYIKPCGYDNYDEYYKDVQEYKLKIQDYEIVEEPYIAPNIPIPYLNNHQSAFLYTINCETNYAFIKNDFTQFDILEKYNYTPVQLGYEYSSGPILSGDGDLRIYLIYPCNIELNSNYFLNKIKNYLLGYYSNVIVDNNDILINGLKVCGSIMMRYNEMKILLMQINFINKTNIIQEICGINEKIPGYIDSNILSAEKLKNEFLTWLQV